MSSDKYSDEETAARFERAIRAALQTGFTPTKYLPKPPRRGLRITKTGIVRPSNRGEHAVESAIWALERAKKP